MLMLMLRGLPPGPAPPPPPSCQVPAINSSWYPDFVRTHSAVDISVAVQTAAGLMVPVVRQADKLGLAGISAEVKALAAKVSHAGSH